MVDLPFADEYTLGGIERPAGLELKLQGLFSRFGFLAQFCFNLGMALGIFAGGALGFGTAFEFWLIISIFFSITFPQTSYHTCVAL